MIPCDLMSPEKSMKIYRKFLYLWVPRYVILFKRHYNVSTWVFHSHIPLKLSQIYDTHNIRIGDLLETLFCDKIRILHSCNSGLLFFHKGHINLQTIGFVSMCSYKLVPDHLDRSGKFIKVSEWLM